MNCFRFRRCLIALAWIVVEPLVTTAWSQVESPTPTVEAKTLSSIPPAAVTAEKIVPRAPDSSQLAKSVVVVETIILQVDNNNLLSPESVIESTVSKLVTELQTTVTSQHRFPSDKVAAVVSSYSGVTALSRPSLALQVGAQGVVSVGQETSLPYMERVDNETFKLRHTDPQKLGIDLSLNVSKANDVSGGANSKRQFILSPVRLELTAIDGRTKVDSVDLPIGRPIVTRRFVETAIQVIEGELALIELPVAKGKHVYMIVLVSNED
jgi:hypothetical protein